MTWQFKACRKSELKYITRKTDMKRITFALLFAALLNVCAFADDKKPKLAEAHVMTSPSMPQYDSVSIEGFWEPANPTVKNELIPTAVKIECFRHHGREFMGNEAFCLIFTATHYINMAA